MPQWPGHAVLQVPVPELEDFVRERTAHYDTGFLGASEVPGQCHVHAHVTALGPFLSPPDVRIVRGIAARTAAFGHTLSRIEVFPDGIIHAVPEPKAPFRALTAALREAFPEVIPYGGLHEVNPHVTLDAVGPGVDVEWVRECLSRVLPCSSRAEALDLVWYEQGNTRLMERFALA
ncbi:2'-5' RNA ligase superfamily protein [Luteococcus japonicus]|uniref:2'-5' RNA ligase superfamily protein n=1 Tax=Luteococcus japonicus TaxID=33984 RepID=A0A3N1ZR38_9ACTN|nr:2'-5' RNA ligase family protein [Luteococcus japonicus]ROR53359.1 2'-5' RNA ligase superfamily protein [Luteococcus japonicus]